MKTLIKIITIFVILIMFSCNSRHDITIDRHIDNTVNSRIKYIEGYDKHNNMLTIYTVDGIEYLSNYHGGLIKLESIK